MKHILAVLIVLTIGSMAWAVEQVPIEVISVQSPAVPSYICYDGSRFWTVRQSHNPGIAYVWQLDGNGSIVQWWVIPGNNNVQGIAWDGSSLWIVDRYNKRVREFRPNGTEVSSWAIPSQFLPFAAGIAWDGSHLWLSAEYRDFLGKFTRQGNLTATISRQCKWGHIYDITVAGGVVNTVVYLAGNLPEWWIWRYDLAGNLVGRIGVLGFDHLKNVADEPRAHYHNSVLYRSNRRGVRGICSDGANYYVTTCQLSRNIYKLGLRTVE